MINAGKTPIIPKIPWGCTANITSDIATLNAQIDQLYTDFPQIIKGPDLYTFFNAHQGDISGDCIHPTDPAGYTDYITQWVNTMETAVYTVPTLSVSPSAGNYSTAQSVTLTSTKAGTIYYTLDGSTPTTASATYSAALAITGTTTVKAMTVDQAGNQADILSASYTFPSSNSSASSTSSSPSTQTVTNSIGINPNMPAGWSRPILFGPHFVGTPTYISGGNSSGETAQTFIGSSAIHDDINVSISIASPTNLSSQITPVPFPWSQGFNTADDIFNYSVVSAFNGYPITKFDKPVTIILPYDSSKLHGIDVNKLTIATYDQAANKWETLPNIVLNSQNHTLATTVTKFSYFVVTYPASIFSSIPTLHVLGDTISLSNPSANLKQEVKKILTPTVKSNLKTTSKLKKLILSKQCLLFICW